MQSTALYTRILGVVLFAAMSGAAASGEITGRGFPLYPGEQPVKAVSVPVRSAAPETPSHKATPAAASNSSIAGTPAAGNEPRPVFPADPSRRDRSGGSREVKMPSIWPALLAVFVVGGLFCAALYLMKKYLPGHRQLFSHPALELLGRTHLDQRRYVSLLRVGKRIIVVGVTQDDMRPLSEITDEAEVTELLEIARPKTEAGLTLFQRLFQRNVLDMEAEKTRIKAAREAEELEGQMTSLRGRVMEIRDTGAGAESDTVVAPRRRSVDATA